MAHIMAAQKKNRKVIEWLASADAANDDGVEMTVEEKKEAGCPVTEATDRVISGTVLAATPAFAAWMRHSKCGW